MLSPTKTITYYYEKQSCCVDSGAINKRTEHRSSCCTGAQLVGCNITPIMSAYTQYALWSDIVRSIALFPSQIEKRYYDTAKNNRLTCTKRSKVCSNPAGGEKTHVQGNYWTLTIYDRAPVRGPTNKIISGHRQVIGNVAARLTYGHDDLFGLYVTHLLYLHRSTTMIRTSYDPTVPHCIL